MDLLVSLVRNGLCVARSLAAAEHWFLQPSVPLIIRDHLVSPANASIALLQFVGMAIIIRDGFRILFDAIQERGRLKRWKVWITSSKTQDLQHQVLRSKIEQQWEASTLSLITGVCLLLIGHGFWFLGCFTLESLPLDVLVWAVVVQQAALAVLVWFMFVSVVQGIRKIYSVKQIYKSLCAGVDSAAMSNMRWNASMFETFQSLLSVDTYWANAASAPVCVQEDFDRRLGSEELDQLRDDIESIMAHSTSFDRTGVKLACDKLVSTITKQTLLDLCSFLLNLLAFHGYNMPIIAFYFEDEHSFKLYVPHWPGHEHASWWGNFLGDLAWTVEPAIYLAVKYSSVERKVKQD